MRGLGFISYSSLFSETRVHDLDGSVFMPSLDLGRRLVFSSLFHVMDVPPPVLRFSRDNESYDHYLFSSGPLTTP